MSKISSDNKKIAATLLDAFGGGMLKVQRYHHETQDLHVDVLSLPNSPCEDMTSFGTIGLSDYPMESENGEFPTRIELVGATLSSFDIFPNIISSAAFNIIRSGRVYHPGLVMKNYVKLYKEDTKLPHLYFTDPFYWENKLKTIQLAEKKVSWLLCFPISDEEAAYFDKNGNNEFEKLLENEGPDIFDTDRDSII